LIVGLDVHVANSGVAAIAMAHGLMPDLVLMDVLMPGLDGPATLKRMRQSVAIAGIPVIFLTAKVLPAEYAHFLQLGAIGVIAKPFDPLKLGDEVLGLWDTTVAPPQGMLSEGVQAQVQPGVHSLANSFLERTRADVLRLGPIVERACQGQTSAMQEIARLAHSIHGAAAMFGYPGVSAAAGSMETWASEATTNLSALGSAIDRGLLEPLLEFMRRLAQETDAAGQTVP
jgi:CheY-like chemotaxis protein